MHVWLWYIVSNSFSKFLIPCTFDSNVFQIHTWLLVIWLCQWIHVTRTLSWFIYLCILWVYYVDYILLSLVCWLMCLYSHYLTSYNYSIFSNVLTSYFCALWIYCVDYMCIDCVSHKSKGLTTCIGSLLTTCMMHLIMVSLLYLVTTLISHEANVLMACAFTQYQPSIVYFNIF